MTHSRKRTAAPEPHVIVLFGATGDLAARKLLPGLFHLQVAGLMPVDYRIIGSSPMQMTAEDFAQHVADVVNQFGTEKAEGADWETFIGKVTYLHSASDAMGPLASAVLAAEAELGAETRSLMYLSIPPFAMSEMVTAIGSSGLAQPHTKVILEKPFGTDLASAKALNKVLLGVFKDRQIFRIDHFLGKEDVQNILAVRFANRMFEPMWNEQHIARIEIDVPETLGVENRAAFYEETGAFKDMVVTHLFQALGFLAMEPPASFTSKDLADGRNAVFEALQPLDTTRVVRGQYEGYRAIEGVPADSDTETMVAVEARIENDRWRGVPIYLRTGKRLAEQRTVITLTLREPPMHMFPFDSEVGPGRLIFEVGQPGSIRIHFRSKEPGATVMLGEAELTFDYGKDFEVVKELEAYERLLHDAMLGDETLFNTARGIERLWEISEPLLLSPPKVLPYEQGTWGPQAAIELPSGGWTLPERPITPQP